ncbi:hypothetical protein ASPWEDRAFT_107607 [Aspergillus wentii DTO 134E9]|uniref:Uncharacterized protein n=1 Tax=Aspergillus wentii DTO 134E9 TaxID=1073089 RepID=A0A1L9RPU9_ASPWE|nr:uncharacterized protein ASPWEDRAFT_107607 [Aspergillus wentii DTO 134E9]KAI9924076.1 hypothetical protein MW887_007315 [Aspergillus wentii]OJJ36883.1 hypothetical protein ASPWEDRAFT_107607 [Aspergillus wentii DTO 134E9]
MDTQSIHQHFKLENIFNVKGKVALVTGGGSGIGLMSTLALAVNGSKVYITGRSQEKLDRVVNEFSEGISGEIIPITADVTNKESIDRLAKEIASREPHLSILINNAGINSHKENVDLEDATDLRKSLFEDPAASMEEWETVFRTNVAHLFFTTTAFLPLLEKGTEHEHNWSSTVINISSISGIVKASQAHFAYNASKAAAIHLTKMLAHEITSSKLKIRVNNIAPGVFPSEMTTRDSSEKTTVPKRKYENLPAGRPGKDEEMASALLFTATNQYLNGQTIVVDGGYVLSTGTI